MAFTKAKIKVENEEPFNVLFNPAEYSLSEGANYAEKTITGLGGPLSQYISGSATTLQMTLMFDTYQTNPNNMNVTGEVVPTDVTKQTEKITKLTRLDGTIHRPPVVTFMWGSLSFKGYVKSVNQSFTMFMENGMPVRAKLDVTFQQYVDVTEMKQTSPFESPDRTKRKTIRAGMQLWQIAWEEYGDAEQWRVIAKANGIMNPGDIYPGMVIKVPSL